jgi:hypothetical protein
VFKFILTLLWSHFDTKDYVVYEGVESTCPMKAVDEHGDAWIMDGATVTRFGKDGTVVTYFCILESKLEREPKFNHGRP